MFVFAHMYLLYDLNYRYINHVYMFFVCFLSLPFPSSAFITSSLLLRICVYICLFFGGVTSFFFWRFLVKKAFPLF